MSDLYVGRIAPSPTGAQHLGNARTYLLAWLLAQQNNGKLLLRVEDLDTPRTKLGATEQIFEDLRWLGITWSPTLCPAGLEAGDCDPLRVSSTTEKQVDFILQSDRISRHREILEQLKELELVYPCTCSRKEIEESSSAPHESSHREIFNSESGNQSANAELQGNQPIDGMIYPGTCSYRTADDSVKLDEQGLKFAWRFRFPDKTVLWTDDFAGEQSLNPKQALGDFVIARNYGPPAYQLAVVVDDHDSGVTHVVRGNDLIYSTYRQLAIYDALGWIPPKWFHVPLVVGSDGRRLAKRHGDTRLVTLKNAGIASETVIGFLAHSLGLIPQPLPITTLELKELVIGQPARLENIPHQAVQIPVHNLSPG